MALFALAFGYASLTLTRTLDLRDEGYLLSRAAAVAAGAVPHRDFRDVYGPGVFSLTGVVLSLFDGRILAVRVLVALAKAGAVAAGFAMASRLAPRWIALLASLCSIAWWGRSSANLNAPYAALFTIPLALAATAVAMRSLERRSVRGLVVAGLLAGLAMLFKQSLGVMLAYGLALSLVGVGWLEAPERAGRARVGLVAWWLACGVAVLLPVGRYLDLPGYLLHFLPFHAVLVAVAWAARRRAPDLRALWRERLLPFVAGAAVAPAGVILFYAAAGGLGELVHDMFVLPLSLRHYALAVAPPPAALAVLLGGVVCLATAGLLGLAGRPARAAAFAGAGVVGLATSRFAIPTDLPRLFEANVLLARAPFALEGVLLPVLLLAGLALAARELSGSPPDGTPSRAGRAAVVPTLVVSSLLCFEVFPRAGHNLWILHGALAPLLALVLARWLERAGPAARIRARGRLRWTAAAGLVAMLPVWLVAPIARPVLLPDQPRSERRPVALPRAQGIALDARTAEAMYLTDVEALVSWLATVPPADAPLLMLTNEEMVPFLSGRALLFPERRYALFLAGWGMLPGAEMRTLDTPAMLTRLRDAREVLVVYRPDPTAANLRRAMPRLRDYVEKNFDLVARFGPYRVLRRAAAASG